VHGMAFNSHSLYGGPRDRRPDAQPRALRIGGVLLLVCAIHILPFSLIHLAPVPHPDEELAFTVDLDDSLLNQLEQFDKAEQKIIAQEIEKPKPPELKQPSQPNQPRPPEQKPPEPKPAPEKAAPKPAPPEPAAAQPKPDPQPAAVAKPEAQKELKDPNLDPLIEVDTAFDESKTTKAVPEKGYLSDRNSTAADKGPKNLPRGDPYIDKGESQRIKYLEKRGEGGLPPLASAASSGSIKKEGNPDAGRGFADERKPDRTLPMQAPVAPEPKKQAGAFEAPPEPPATRTTPQPLVSPPAPQVATTEIKKTEKLLGDGPGVEDVAVTVPPRPLEQTPVPTARREPVPPRLTAPPPVIDNAVMPQATAPKPPKPIDELDAFKALLDGKNDTAGRGGDVGEKAGMLGREGQRGHEGDGTLRPGHDEAVSDVTTVNLSTSAAEFDDARFAKKFDPKTAYIKPLARRIDGKWKAEIVARQRTRMVRGIVTVRVTLRNDGTLIDTREVRRTPDGLPDEYVAIIKTAVARAAAPRSEPFPAELADKETLVFEFSFLY
jgi:hypothetical protein